MYYLIRLKKLGVSNEIQTAEEIYRFGSYNV